MKCVCNRTCQTRIGGEDGHIAFFEEGNIAHFDKCPTHFSPLEEGNDKVVDFMDDSQQVLMALKWKFEDAEKFVKDSFNLDLKKGPKGQVVEQIMDARFRALDINPNKQV